MKRLRKGLAWLYLVLTGATVFMGVLGWLPVELAVPQAAVLGGLTVLKFFIAYDGK